MCSLNSKKVADTPGSPLPYLLGSGRDPGRVGPSIPLPFSKDG